MATSVNGLAKGPRGNLHSLPSADGQLKQGCWPPSRPRARRVQACSFEPGRTRVTESVTAVPRRVDAYFRDHFPRRALWCCISLFGGYYAGNMVSLAFGALAINDVVAAVTTVAICEVISRGFYSQWPRPPLWLIFANFFKMGVEFAFMADAFKLAG